MRQREVFSARRGLESLPLNSRKPRSSVSSGMSSLQSSFPVYRSVGLMVAHDELEFNLWETLLENSGSPSPMGSELLEEARVPGESSNVRARSSFVFDGVDRSVHRSLLKGVGVTDEDIAKPLIAVVNSWNEIVPGHIHLDRLASHVKKGIREAGGTPLEFNTSVSATASRWATRG